MLVRYCKTENGNTVKRAEVYTKQEHPIRRKDIDPDAVSIILRLRSAGHVAYIVGGAVRDLLVGRIPKDFDIVTDAHPRRIKRLFRNSRIIGKRFRLAHIFFGSKIIEVSTFRSLNPGEGELNQYGTIQEDVLRRDFTLNALYYCPVEEVILDYVGGVKDIRKKVIQPLIPLKRIFVEDPVRMLRAVKYAAMLEFTFSFLTRRKIHKQAPLLAACSNSRLTEELFKILASGASSAILKALYTHKLLQYFIPSLDARLKGNKNQFFSRFFKTLEEFDRSGEDTDLRYKGLISLLKDYLQDLAEERKGETLLLKDYYVAAKEFLSPLVPANKDIDRAVMDSIHKTRPKRPRKRRSKRSKAPPAEAILTDILFS
ncbi:MAG: polynucleotide adenylyltransferase PcnB [Spirochaetales bacterium]|nr:polynucleotide adenylyltransferase PcnB [Spirochaetales bacterium]